MKCGACADCVREASDVLTKPDEVGEVSLTRAIVGVLMNEALIVGEEEYMAYNPLGLLGGRWPEQQQC